MKNIDPFQKEFVLNDMNALYNLYFKKNKEIFIKYDKIIKKY